VTSERQLYVGLASRGGVPATPAGLLKLQRQGVMESGEFAYGRQYLQSPGAVALNPTHLPLQEAVFPLAPQRLRDGGALPLTLRDAMPDAWGRRVLEAQHGPLSDVDLLLLTNADRVGSMVFGESLPIDADAGVPQAQNLDALAQAAAQLEAGKEPDRALKRLLQGGGSLGGTRPKATFIHGGRRHIAKFPSRGDAHDVEALEASMLALARLCGIAVPAFFLHPLLRGQALLLERFDREGPAEAEGRRHYLSAAAVLDVRYESSDGSYVELAQAIRRLGAQPQMDLLELYRRLVFNLVVDNSDDHVKNHGMLLRAEGWRLAPAFDLVMQLSNLGYQALAILPGRLDSHLGLALEAAPQFGLTTAQAQAVVEGVAETIHIQAPVVLDAYGADAALRRRAQACLEKQARIIGL
jgi:serine/threonine-protein kinase HipA